MTTFDGSGGERQWAAAAHVACGGECRDVRLTARVPVRVRSVRFYGSSTRCRGATIRPGRASSYCSCVSTTLVLQSASPHSQMNAIARDDPPNARRRSSLGALRDSDSATATGRAARLFI